MRFDASEEQQQLQTITRRFLEDTAPLPAVRLWARRTAGFDRDWWRRAADLGWTSLLVPESQGGSAAGEAGTKAWPTRPLSPRSGDGWCRPGRCSRPASPPGPWPRPTRGEGRATLEDTLSGATVCAWVVGEGEHPWLGVPPRCGRRGGRLARAHRHGTSRRVRRDCECLLVAACLAMRSCISSYRPRSPACAGARRELDLVRRHADLTFDGVVVPGPRSSPERAGRAVLTRQGQIANIILCAEMVGAASRAFELTLENAGERYSFGRPLASYQVLKHRLADMKLWIEASHAAVEAP